MISRILLQDERFEESLKVSERWAQLRPYSSQPYERMAQVHLNQENSESALAAYDQAISVARQFESEGVEAIEKRRDEILTKNP